MNSHDKIIRRRWLTSSPAGPAWDFRVPAGQQTELNEFQKILEQFKYGAMSEAQFRTIRVPMRSSAPVHALRSSLTRRKRLPGVTRM